MLKEFKEFAIKGNIIDMAVGVIIGGAFGKIVTSLVNDVVMPVISFFTGKIDFTNLFFTIDGTTYATLADAQAAGAVTLNYGTFITTVLDFLIIAFCIFIFVNKISKNNKKVAPTTIKTCPYCKTSINITATRCPNCTSELEETKIIEEIIAN